MYMGCKRSTEFMFRIDWGICGNRGASLEIEIYLFYKSNVNIIDSKLFFVTGMIYILIG